MFYNLGMSTETRPDENELLLDRLMRIKVEAEAAAEAATIKPEIRLVSTEFIHLASIAMKDARTRIIQSRQLGNLEIVASKVIVPDNQLANADNHEINLTSFVHQYLPQDEWPRYIKEEDR